MNQILGINFTKEKFISIEEMRRSRLLKNISITLVIFLLFLTILISGLNFYISNKLAQEKEKDSLLVTELGSPTNKKKETLLFLTKNRLGKLALIKRAYQEKTKYLKILKDQIAKLFPIISYSLSEKNVTLSIETTDYSQFDNFTKSLKNYQIDEKSLYVSSINFNTNLYQISCKFNFL